MTPTRRAGTPALAPLYFAILFINYLSIKHEQRTKGFYFMRLRKKEIRVQRKRQADRWKLAHPGVAVAGATATPAAATGRAGAGGTSGRAGAAAPRPARERNSGPNAPRDNRDREPRRQQNSAPAAPAAAPAPTPEG